MSLLLCFFIMLFAMSIITPKRFQALCDTLSQDFTGYAGSSKERSKSNKPTTTASDSAAKSNRLSSLVGGQPIPGPLGESPDVHTIPLEGETVRNGLIRFELGRDELTDQAKWGLRAIVPELRGSPYKIEVKGYTAPSEGGGGYQRDVTLLAFSRAFSVVEYLVELGLDPSFFDIATAPETLPAPSILPAGTDPGHAGASVEIRLLNRTLRQLRE